MKKRLLFLYVLMVQVVILSAQKITMAATPESAGFSSQRLLQIDKSMNDWVQKGWMNGGAAVIIHNGKIVYYKAAGYNDLGSKTILQKDAIFRIASQSKAITSVAIMMLFEEGKLLLDDNVSKYIPAFKKQVVIDKFNETDTTYTSVPAKPFGICSLILLALVMHKLVVRRPTLFMRKIISQPALVLPTAPCLMQ